MPRSKQDWQVGDVFVVPLRDRSLVVGQVVGQEPEVLNSATVAFFDHRVSDEKEVQESPLPRPSTVFAALFVTRDLLDSGDWPVVAHGRVDLPSALLPYENLRDRGFVGAKVIGSGIVEDFLSAFYGLAPWDDWKDPNYLDGLLLSHDKKPVDRLVFKRPDSTTTPR